MEQVSKEISDFVRNVRNAFTKLPVKNEGSKMKIIAELLEQDFKKVRHKGYSHKEIVEYLKQQNLAMPAYLVKKYMAKIQHRNGQGDDNTVDDKQVNKETPKDNGAATQQEMPQTKTDMEDAPMDKQPASEPDNAMAKETQNPQEITMPAPLIKKGKFVIMPDTPDGEL